MSDNEIKRHTTPKEENRLLPAEPVIADAIGKLDIRGNTPAQIQSAMSYVHTYVHRKLSGDVLRKFGFSECISIALGTVAATRHRQEANLARNQGHQIRKIG